MLLFFIFIFVNLLLGQGIVFLYRQHTSALLQEAISDYEVDSLWSPSSCAEHMLIGRLLQPPAVAGFPVHEDALTFLQLLDFLASIPRKGKKDTPPIYQSSFIFYSFFIWYGFFYQSIFIFYSYAYSINPYFILIHNII